MENITTAATSISNAPNQTSNSSSQPVAAGMRAVSPSLSEASTSSSNHSLDLMRCKKCSVDSCSETIVVSGKRRKGPWMCNYHRNKTYKAKKKQKEQMHTSMQMLKKKREESLPRPPHLQAILNGDQPPPNDGLPRLHQVLNEKKLALLRSPTIIKFLRESQQQLSNNHQSQDALHTKSMTTTKRSSSTMTMT